MSTPATALQTLASRIFATAKGHAYDSAASQGAIATILEAEGLTPAVLAAQAVTASSAAAAQTAAQQASEQFAIAQEDLANLRTQLGIANDQVAKHEAIIAEHKAAIAERDHRITAMKDAAAKITAA